MSCRTHLLLGLLAVALVGVPAAVDSNQSSRGAEWRRPSSAPVENPDMLLQRAQELIHRATQAAAAGQEQQVSAAGNSDMDEPMARVEDESSVSSVAPMNESADDPTIRLVMDGSGEATAAMPAKEEVDAGQENLPLRQSLPAPRVELAVAPPTASASDAVPSVQTSNTANRTGGSSQLAMPLDDRLELAVHTSNDEGVIHAAEEEVLPTPAGSTPSSEQLIPPNGQLLLPDGQPYSPGGSFEPACSDVCGPPPRPLFWVAGVEASFLWPDLNREGGTSFSFDNEASEFWHSSVPDGIDSMYLTPRLWLGIQGCAWGFNARYWHLRACEGDFNPATDEINGWDYDEWDWDKNPDTGSFTNNCFDAYTIDLEVTRRFCLQDCAMLASFGVRHGSIENNESVVGTSLGDNSRFAGYGYADRFSRGTGIVMGLYGRKPLFPCSCVHWFYNARWSALWGKTGTAAETFAIVTIDGGNAGSVNGARTCVNDTLFIGEVQLGLEWDYALQCLPANAFVRAAVEYQRWDGGKGYSEAGSFATYTNEDDYTSTASTFASAAAPQMDLVGITIGTGLTW